MGSEGRAKIEAILMDCGGVLLLPHPGIVAAALAANGIRFRLSRAAASEAHYIGMHAVDDQAHEGSELNRYLRNYCRAYAVQECDVERAVGLLKNLWRSSSVDVWRLVVPNCKPALVAMARCSVRLAVVSNARGQLEQQLRRRRICQVGDGAGVQVAAIVDSGVVGIEKPDPRIFELALRPMGVTPCRALYVGDSVRYDVQPASMAGLISVHFDPYHLCCKPGEHLHVDNLAQLLAYL